MRNAATTASMVRTRFTFTIPVRSPGRYGAPASLATTPSEIPRSHSRARSASASTGVRRTGSSTRAASARALLVGQGEERLVLVGQQVEGHERGRRLLAQASHAGGGRVDALPEEVELLHAVDLDDDLAVDHEAGVGEGQHVLDDLGEVAVQGLAVAALEEDLVAVAEDQRAKAVPLGLVAPALALRHVGGGTRELGRDGRG